MLSKTSFLQLMIVCLVILGIWFTFANFHQPSPLLKSRYVESYALQMQTFHTDETGKLHDILASPLVIEYGPNSIIALAPIKFTLYETPEEIWEITAKNGQFLKNKQELTLWNNVKINQFLLPQKTKNASINTQQLIVNLNRHTGFTNQPVTLEKPAENAVFQSEGMAIDFHAKTIQLLHQVTGQIKVLKTSHE